MTNNEKYTTLEEQKEAHDEWCINKNQRCCSYCDYCFNKWLDLDTEDAEGDSICDALEAEEDSDDKQ